MDFTREPIIETVITPKEGCKIVVRSSKNVGQEEYFVDALEVVSFGKAIFFRSLEKPKSFLVPATDYEILEVREARMVLKNVGLDRSIKIGGGREAKAPKETPMEKAEPAETEEISAAVEEQGGEARTEKKRDRRRQQRRRRGRDEQPKEDAGAVEALQGVEGESIPTSALVTNGEGKAQVEVSATQASSTTSFMSALLPPPSTLISETIGRYKENVLFKNAFYTKEENESESSVGEQKEEEKSEDQSQEATGQHADKIEPAQEEEHVIPPYATFWDDINEPAMPPMPFIEVKEPPQQEPPSALEENKE